jgi:tetratricopeptide (TPR) repeat protein
MESIDNRMQRARVLMDRCRPELALEELTQALSQKPDHPEALVWLGLCMARLGNFAEGLPHMQRAIALDPDQGIWHCYYAEALKLQKDVIRAKQSIDVAISLDSERANFHIELAEILVIAYREKQNDLEQMLHDIPEGLDPNRPQLLCELPTSNRSTDILGASQFNGRSPQDSIAYPVLHALQGQESWFPRPKFLLVMRTY